MTARFYYDLNSPYSYLAAHRVDAVLPGEVEWVPIAFPFVLRAQGRTPWSLQPGRETGMRDCERRAAELGLPPMVWPDGWPADTYSVDGARAALAAKAQGREREMTKAIFARVFVHGGALNDRAALEAAAAEAGVEGLGEALGDPGLKAALSEQTDDAIARGVAGIPTVEVGGELFWGDDRLEEAAKAAA
jgi:2-hydroxychromene-2-carboxylate isomerase